MLVVFDMDLDPLRGDAVCDHLQAVFAMRKIMRHVKMRVMDGCAGGDPHRRMIECPAEQGQCLAVGMSFSERKKNLFAGHLFSNFLSSRA